MVVDTVTLITTYIYSLLRPSDQGLLLAPFLGVNLGGAQGIMKDVTDLNWVKARSLSIIISLQPHKYYIYDIRLIHIMFNFSQNKQNNLQCKQINNLALFNFICESIFCIYLPIQICTLIYTQKIHFSLIRPKCKTQRY